MEDGNLLGSLLPLLLLAAAFYLLILRPARRRTQQQRQTVAALAVGAEVLMAGGIVGIVAELDPDGETMLVEVGPGVRVRFVRSAVARVTGGVSDGAHDDLPGDLPGSSGT